MARAHRRTGTTLIELTVVMTVLGVLLAMAIPTLGRGLDAIAVRRARDALAAGVARARAVAVARGGARLVVALGPASFWVETRGGDTVGIPVDLAADYGVALEASGSVAGPLELRFDALGIGRLSNRSISVRRDRAEAGLTLSSYGRVRRW